MISPPSLPILPCPPPFPSHLLTPSYHSYLLPPILDLYPSFHSSSTLLSSIPPLPTTTPSSLSPYLPSLFSILPLSPPSIPFLPSPFSPPSPPSLPPFSLLSSFPSLPPSLPPSLGYMSLYGMVKTPVIQDILSPSSPSSPSYITSPLSSSAMLGTCVPTMTLTHVVLSAGGHRDHGMLQEIRTGKSFI